jgi:hypothetical protein
MLQATLLAVLEAVTAGTLPAAGCQAALLLLLDE